MKEEAELRDPTKTIIEDLQSAFGAESKKDQTHYLGHASALLAFSLGIQEKTNQEIFSSKELAHILAKLEKLEAASKIELKGMRDAFRDSLQNAYDNHRETAKAEPKLSQNAANIILIIQAIYRNTPYDYPYGKFNEEATQFDRIGRIKLMLEVGEFSQQDYAAMLAALEGLQTSDVKLSEKNQQSISEILQILKESLGEKETSNENN